MSISAVCSQDLDSGVVTPENLPEAPVAEKADKEEAAPQPIETAPQPTQAAAIEETPQPGSPVEAQQEGPSNVNTLSSHWLRAGKQAGKVII